MTVKLKLANVDSIMAVFRPEGRLDKVSFPQLSLARDAWEAMNHPVFVTVKVD